MKILYIVGNRPQFIKLAMLHAEAKKNASIQEVLIHTGQHFSSNMSDIFFAELGIDLPIIKLCIDTLPHATMIGQMMISLEPEIKKCNPDFILVFGDTNTTLAGALTGKKMNIPVIHIEAGIRTYEEGMPEESNRYITDRIADVNFCCTKNGVDNLLKEGFDSKSIRSQVVNAGDLMLDAYHYYFPSFVKSNRILEQQHLKQGEYILFTLHRKQNLEDAYTLRQIVNAIEKIDKIIRVLCPLHPNTKNILQQNGITYDFRTIPPLGYLDMQYVLHHSKYVITDSGGVQREAFFAKKPTLILMERPFWPEVIEYGNAINCCNNIHDILIGFDSLSTQDKVVDTKCFGDGKAAQKIINHLLQMTNTIIT